MADSENQQPIDSAQQVTSKTPTRRPKNPKWVTASKAIGEKTRKTRKVQKKALAEANIIISNNQLKQAAPQFVDPPVAATPVDSESTKNVLTMAQCPSVISILVSIMGIYYKREAF